MDNTLQVIDGQQTNALARKLRFIPKVYLERFIRISLDSYESYIENNSYFWDDGDDFPAALHILNSDVDRYRDNSPLFELMVDSIAESLHNENPSRYPEPYGAHWQDEHEMVCRDIIAQGWDGFQSVIVHDMESVFLHMNMSFRIPEEERIVNHPIVEVW